MSNQYPCTKFSCGSDFEQWCEQQEHPNKDCLDNISNEKVNEWNCKGASICIEDGELRLCDKDGNKLSGVDICKSDGISIERGADGSMCVVGIKNSNTGGIVKLWLGTIEQYNASVTVPNPNYIYWVTDMSMAQIITHINNLVTRMGVAESNITELQTKSNDNADKIEKIIDGTTTVGKATNSTNATNVTSTINGKAITDIFEEDGITVKNATSVNEAVNVTEKINNKLITDIFENDGETVKNATRSVTSTTSINAEYASVASFLLSEAPAIDIEKAGVYVVYFTCQWSGTDAKKYSDILVIYDLNKNVYGAASNGSSDHFLEYFASTRTIKVASDHNQGTVTVDKIVKILEFDI